MPGPSQRLDKLRYVSTKVTKVNEIAVAGYSSLNANAVPGLMILWLFLQR